MGNQATECSDFLFYQKNSPRFVMSHFYSNTCIRPFPKHITSEVLIEEIIEINKEEDLLFHSRYK